MGQKEMNTTAVDVLKARRVLQGAINRTPLTHSKSLSELCGAEVHLKWENLQRTGSYKPRGALYRMSLLSPEERRLGVITASAGNWALGVAMGAQSLGFSAMICIPANTPKVKADRCKALGAEIVFHGSNFDEAMARCQELVKKSNKVFVSGSDDFDVFSGHGTVGLEILEDLPDVETIVAPVGGGGLLTGISVWAKTVNPKIRVMGVQSTEARTLYECYKAGKLVDVPVPPTICEGLAGGISQLNLHLALKWFDDIVLADEDKLKSAILWLLKHERQLAEGSGVVGPAAILQGKIKFRPGEKVAVVITGGNIDLEALGIRP